MKIEVGKTYLTRDGRKAFVLGSTEHTVVCSAIGCPNIFVCDINNGEFVKMVKVKFLPNKSGYDLISIYTDPRLKKCIEALERIIAKDARPSIKDGKEGFEITDITNIALKTLKEIGELKCQKKHLREKNLIK